MSIRVLPAIGLIVFGILMFLINFQGIGTMVAWLKIWPAVLVYFGFFLILRYFFGRYV